MKKTLLTCPSLPYVQGGVRGHRAQHAAGHNGVPEQEPVRGGTAGEGAAPGGR